MYEHHKQAIENLIEYFKDDSSVIAIVLGGSVAKGLERVDSDIDAMIIVTDERYYELEKENRLCECISGYCDYEGGYFDLKYLTKDFIKAISTRGSEPARNAFLCSRCLRSSDDEIFEIVKNIPVFQKQEKEEKLLSFYSAMALNFGYLWNSSEDNFYLRTRAASDLVLFGFRLLLEENEVFFPCHKSLIKTVERLTNKPENIIEKSELLLKRLDNASKEDFVNSILNFVEYKPPNDDSVVLTRFVDDNEQWWYKNRPVITEW